MSAMISVSVDTTEPKVEPPPLAEKPAKIDEPATSSPTSSLQELPQIVTPQAYSADGSNESSAAGSHHPESSSSSSSNDLTADVLRDEADKDTIDNDDTKPFISTSDKDLETVTDRIGSESTKADANANSVSAAPKTENHIIQHAVVAREIDDQSVNSADNKFMDPNDTENKGNVSKSFFTSDVKRCLSPIDEQGSITIKFSEMADLFVKTTNDKGRVFIFQVHSATLEAASTVFYDMVYTSNTRGNKEAWVWDLDDSIVGLKVMFALLHNNYRAALFTQEPTSQQVYEVLRVLAKYGIQDEAFHPFVRSWLEGFRSGLSDTQLTSLQRLYTAYKLGDFRTLKSSIRKVAHDVEVSEDGSMVLDKMPIQAAVPITDELVANIQAVRAQDLSNILSPLQTAYEILMGDTNEQDPIAYCKSTDGQDECNEKLLGSLLGNLRRQKLRPIPNPSTFTGRVGALAEKVSQMDVRGLIVPNLEPHKQRHGRCKLEQDDVARHLLECKAYVPLYDDLVEQVVTTTKQVGTTKAEETEFEDYKDVFDKASIKYDETLDHSFWGWEDDATSTRNVSL